MDTTQIRPGLLSDANELARLMGDLGYATTPAQMEMRLGTIARDPQYKTFVAENKDHLIGMIGVRTGMSYERDGVIAQIVTLVVDAAFRGQGIGKRLVNVAEEWARTQSANKLLVTTSINRTQTHRFYQSTCGLEKTGYRFAKEFTQPMP